MSNDKNNEFHGEQLTPEIARKAIYELGRVDRVPPAVGIFDSPTRCFVVNQEWWSHIAGMVHLLADVVSWQDADDESYFAIQEILKFMQGIECMDFSLRQDPADNCMLQQTVDGGDTWTDVFDFSLCATIQDKSQSVNIQNSVTYVQPTYQSIYNNYVANYAGTPESVYPDLADPTGDDSALRAAYCNAIFTLVTTACDAAINYYKEFDELQNEFNVGIGIATAVLAIIALAAALPTAGASLAALGPIATLWGASIGIGAIIGNQLVDEWQGHTIDQFQDTEAREEVTCYLFEEVAAADNSLATMQAALASHTLTGNAAAIADTLSLLLANDALYAAFLEKWNNNKQYADAGIDLYCPCASGNKVWVWDFANGLGDFDITQGVFEGGRVRGIDSTTLKAAIITMPFNPAWRIRSAKLFTERIGGTGNGFGDSSHFRMRPTPGSDTGSFMVFLGGFRPNGEDIRCNTSDVAPFYWSTANEIQIQALASDPANVSEIYIDRVEIMFVEDFAKGGYTTDDSSLCS